MDLYNAALGQNGADEPIELSHEQYLEAKEHYEGILARGDASRRLATNPDFQLLIIEGYLTNEGNRLQELLTSGRVNNQMTIDGIVKDMVAVGSFRNYMKTFSEQAHIAQAELEALEEAWELALSEAAETGE